MTQTTKPSAAKKATTPKTPVARARATVRRSVASHSTKTAKAVKAVSAPKPSTVAHATYEFIRAVGRRKEAVARIRLYPKGKGQVTINQRELSKYFPAFEQQQQVVLPLKLTGTDTSFDIGVKVSGGGIHGQAEAVRHGIARALLRVNEDYRRPLRAAGCLTRDSRVKERKKYGLKKARRAPQFSKR